MTATTLILVTDGTTPRIVALWFLLLGVVLGLALGVLLPRTGGD